MDSESGIDTIFMMLLCCCSNRADGTNPIIVYDKEWHRSFDRRANHSVLVRRSRVQADARYWHRARIVVWCGPSDHVLGHFDKIPERDVF